MGRFTVDSSEWPFVRVTYVDSVDDAAFERYVQEQAALLERKEPYVVLFDARRSGMPTAKQRQRMARYMRDHETQLRRYCRRGAFVIESPLIRGALTAILWIQPLPFPHEVFASVEDAERFLR
ncbi:MAG: STAS/SEC14 domain-containing protein [Myxococcota bacterium]|jgi:hypothetical protein|nr:STAS/SEC14 domain-containing protein [Myxococcota bacterium]